MVSSVAGVKRFEHSELITQSLQFLATVLKNTVCSVIPKLLGQCCSQFGASISDPRLSGPMRIQPVLLHGDLWVSEISFYQSHVHPYRVS